MDRIQLVQNYAARIISGIKKFDHISSTISGLGQDGYELKNTCYTETRY